MNAEPHVHQVKIERYYSSIDRGCWQVVYGDTVKNARYYLPLTEWRLRRTVRRAVRAHDKGSVRAGRNSTERLTLQQVAEAEAQRIAARGWPS